jgi:hypothetical protein
MVPTGTGTCGLLVVVCAWEALVAGLWVVTFVANGAIAGTIPESFIGSDPGVLVVALYIDGVLIGALGEILSDDLIGAGAMGFAGAMAGDFKGAFVDDRIGALIAENSILAQCICIHSFQIRCGLGSLSRCHHCLLVRFLVESLYCGLSAEPGPGPRRMHISMDVIGPRGVEMTIVLMPWS